ncbi:phosphonate metabolism protein/1,5-bisphosphokinase (PRPP-forming) PhnN [Gemmobacter lanyuensis]
MTEAEFDALAASGAFALHWRAHGLRYAIPVAQLAGTGTVLLNLSRAVLPDAARRFPDLTVVLVTAPAVLAARLAGRGRESGDDQVRRLARADFALPDGLAVRQVLNDGTPALGLVRFLAALQPERV